MMIKKSADVVIIGGGVNGCSIAYNLANEGCNNVVILEKKFLASGATGRCGAGIRQQWGTKMNCLLASKSMEIMENINTILGVERDIELKQEGYLLLAFSDKEMEQFEKNLQLQHKYNIPSKLLTPTEAKE